MKILLTGASGFLGKHLLHSLINKYGKENIVALTSKPIADCPYLLHKDYNFNEDYFLESNFSEIDIIIHAGAFTPKNSATTNDVKLCQTNILNTEKLLSSNLPMLKKFIFFSTLDVYGEDSIINEESIVKPISLYGSSKLYCEKMVEAWAKANNKICQNLRIGHVYGKGEEVYQKIIPSTISKILKNKPIELWGTGEDLRCFIHTSDVVKAITSSLTLISYVNPINIVNDEQISIIDLINKIIKLSNKQCKINKIASNATPRNLVFDNAKMKKYLWTPKKNFDEGLLEEIQYMESLL